MARPTSDHFLSSDEARRRAREALSPRRQVKYGPDLWSSVIGFLRVALPLAALGLGAVTLAWPFLNTTEVAFTLAKDEVAEGDGRVLLKNLRYVGTDAQNRRFRIAAREGEQSNPDARRVVLRGIDADITLEPETPLAATANQGVYRIDDGTLVLGGDVTITSRAYQLTMGGAEVNLKSKIADGDGDIRGDGPLGTLSADRMRVDVDQQVGSFEGNVRLYITPARPVSGIKTSLVMPHHQRPARLEPSRHIPSDATSLAVAQFQDTGS